MSVPVVMPQLGLTMTEGSVSEWLKKPGDPVRKGEMLFVVSTDKADMEVESLDEGTLAQIIVEPGKVVPVGTVIAYLAASGEAAAQSPEATQTPAAPSSPAVQPEAAGAAAAEQVPPMTEQCAKETEGLPASPRARKVAHELGIDIAQVTPRSGSGRIVEDDVRRYAESIQPAIAKSAAPDLRRRQIIAERLTQSVHTIPHFSVSVEVRADRLLSLRESLKGEKQAGIKITVTDLLFKALAIALEDTPQLQMSWSDSSGPVPAANDLGLAIASERGVVAPVLRNIAALDLAQLARWRQNMTQKAREGRLALADLEGGAGTLSNLGMYRVDRFNAIISPGQSFILAVGKIAPRPWVEAGTLTVTPTASLTLTVDHRVADGASAALFLQTIAEVIENPYRLLWSPGGTKNA